MIIKMLDSISWEKTQENEQFQIKISIEVSKEVLLRILSSSTRKNMNIIIQDQKTQKQIS